MIRKFCIDCRHFDNGRCYRYPPINTVDNAVSDYTTSGVSFGHPVVHQYKWCGEFKHKNNLIKRIYKKIWLKFHHKPNYPHV